MGQTWILLALGVVLALRGLSAQPAELQLPLEPGPDERIDAAWLTRAGEDALEAGLPAIADGLLRKALEREDIAEDQRQKWLLLRASALISLDRYGEARRLLDSMPEPARSPAWRLRRAIVDLHENHGEGVSERLAMLEPRSLSEADRPWYYLLEGLMLEHRGEHSQAVESFQKARDLAGEGPLAPRFEAMLQRLRVLYGKIDEAGAEDLREKAIAYRGKQVGHQFARLYATALANLGQREEAIAVIENQVSRLDADQSGELGPFLLLHGVIAGVNTPAGRAKLRQLLRTPAERELLRTALVLFASTPYFAEEPEEVRAFLTSLIESGPDEPEHPLLDELLYLRSILDMQAGAYDAAAADARLLLERFPASPLAEPSRRLLAHVALRRDPPQYRAAADILSGVREDLPAGPERVRLGLVVADAYFRNGDFETASGVYRSVYDENQAWVEGGPILRQIVLSELMAGRIDEARSFLDALARAGDIPARERWRAEWVFTTHLRENGFVAQAYERLQRSLREGELDRLEPALRLRLLWLEARLAFESGAVARVPYLTEYLLAALRGRPGEALEPGFADTLTAYVLLLRGQAGLALDRVEDALAVLADLRRLYPDSRPAILSFMVEAHQLSEDGRVVEAQQRLRELADGYPDSDLAPRALFEAAVNAQARGLNQSHQEALAILDQLAERYPDSPLVFEARLRQGNILRDMGAFGDAQNAYESLLNTFPDHPRAYRAEFGRAYCLSQEASRDPSRAETAAAAFERLFDLPGLEVDARVEAGYQAARVLANAEQPERAAEMHWLVLTRFLEDTAAASSLRERGRYWMSRNVLDLAGTLAAEGRREEAFGLYGKILETGLPGASIARARREALLPAEPALDTAPETAALEPS